MSWGERSCKSKKSCQHNPTMETCNVNCPGYVWDGVTKPDSAKSEPMPMPIVNNEPKQSESTAPTIKETGIFLERVKLGYKPTDAELKFHSENLKKFVARKQGINVNQVDGYLRNRNKARRVLRKQPKRNQDCPCGSGRQYRKCCGRFSR